MWIAWMHSIRCLRGVTVSGVLVAFSALVHPRSSFAFDKVAIAVSTRIWGEASRNLRDVEDTSAWL